MNLRPPPIILSPMEVFRCMCGEKIVSCGSNRELKAICSSCRAEIVEKIIENRKRQAA